MCPNIGRAGTCTRHTDQRFVTVGAHGADVAGDPHHGPGEGGEDEQRQDAEDEEQRRVVP